MPKIVVATAFAVGLIAGITLKMSATSSQAAELSSCVIPKDYGAVKAASANYFVFEGSDGTIRLVTDACQTIRTIARK